MRLDLTIPSYVILGIIFYYVVLFVMSLKRRARRTVRLHAQPPGKVSQLWVIVGKHVSGRRRWNDNPFFVVVVPARNEELVLSNSISKLVDLTYEGELRILVMNDASTDGTAEVMRQWERDDWRVRTVHRSALQGGKGKSAVLNHAYQTVVRWLDSGDPWFAGASAADVVLGIVDADGQLESQCLERVAPYFSDQSVGATQIGVRIANARLSLLARMQDIEFVAFSWLVQSARDWTGSSGLGGNGQFTRLTALMSIGETPWTPDALSEDLDLGLRLVEHGWRTRFCHLTYVDQQGLDRWKPLLRQRTRWIQGHYQCWRYIPRLVKCRGIPMRTRLDLSAYLLLVVTVIFVALNLTLGILGTYGILNVKSSFLVGIVPYGLAYRAVSLFLAFLPLAIVMTSYQLHSASPFRWYLVPAAAVLFTLYAYIWFYASVRAWTRFALRRKAWVKTPRVASLAVDLSSA